MEKIRTFVAVEISEEQREKIKKMLEEFKKQTGTQGISYVKPENLHITLRFFGDLSEEEIKIVKESLKKISEETVKFKMSLKKVGAFPSLNYVKVLWAGVESGADELKNLKGKIYQIKVGKRDKREFTAHITFARVKFLKDKEEFIGLVKRFESEEFGETEVNEISLKKSELKPTGAVYSDLARFKLIS